MYTVSESCWFCKCVWSRRFWCGLKRDFFVECAIITDTDFSVYDNLILLRVNMYRSCDRNTLAVHNIVWYVLHIINKIYFVLCECEVFIGMLFIFLFIQVFIVLLSLFLLCYFVNFTFSNSVVWRCYLLKELNWHCYQYIWNWRNLPVLHLRGNIIWQVK